FIDPGSGAPVTLTSVTSGPRLGTFWLNTAEELTEGNTYTVIVLGAVTAGGQPLVVDTQSFTHGAGYESVGIHVGHFKEPSGALATALTRTAYARGLFATAEGRPGLESNPL